MGLSNLTVIKLAISNDFIYDASSNPNEEGKYCGFISYMERNNYRMLVSTQPVYNSQQEAIDDMRNLKKDCEIAWHKNETATS